MKKLLFVLIATILFACNSTGEITTDSGLKYTVITSGNGPVVENGKEIHTQCVLTLEDGKEVWSTRKDGMEFTFIMGKTSLIAGFNEALSLMKEGDRFKVIIPANLAYGANGMGSDIPPNSTLIYDIEVTKVTDPADL